MPRPPAQRTPPPQPAESIRKAQRRLVSAAGGGGVAGTRPVLSQKNVQHLSSSSGARSEAAGYVYKTDNNRGNGKESPETKMARANKYAVDIMTEGLIVVPPPAVARPRPPPAACRATDH
ncbi:hypothetical protein EVAR_36883_1 [Eumeta japonica]|uniref:Uncharacterized protein n=1 Tax=Eumeta variegata TaxID=151549 RepID=A0A4C1WT23_EUMVA|nr:hypothetical protein EVAR_36883_1 [Eumeta japonica]